MRFDEYTLAVDLLPAHLRDRAEPLRPYLRRKCELCLRISDALELAVLAARYDEIDSAAEQLDAAESLAAEHDAAGTATTGTIACRTGSVSQASLRGRGVVGRWRRVDSDLVAATDASWKDRTGGIAYVVSDGRFGLRGRVKDRRDPSGPSRVLINELRAVEYLLSGFDSPPERLTVLVDSRLALHYLYRWQAGETGLMPAGYDLRERAHDVQPTLVRLAELVPTLPGVTFEHVKGHAGHPLNEAADALSSMARRRLCEQFDLRTRAADLVNAFLRDWHTVTAAA